MHLILLADIPLDPQGVSSELGTPPFQSWRLGDSKRLTLPDGTVREFDGAHECSGWKLLSPLPDRPDPLHEQLDAWTQWIQAHQDSLHRLATLGWSATLSGLCYEDDTLSIPPDALHLLATCGITLKFNCFA